MKRRRMELWILVLGIAVQGTVGCSKETRICNPGEMKQCACAERPQPGIQICETAGARYTSCACEGGMVGVDSQGGKPSLGAASPREKDPRPFVFEAGVPIPLPPPTVEGGKPLMEALKARKTSRDFSDDTLDRQTLGDLLWAAWGINRKDLGKRTAPSAMNWQELEVYVALEQGLFVYDGTAHALVPRVDRDIRAQTGKQPFVGFAPVNLVYVSDLSKMKDAPEDKKRMYAGAHAGFAAQNVYLFCASEGLATVIRAYLDPAGLAEAMELGEDQFISLAQTVGRPSASQPSTPPRPQ